MDDDLPPLTALTDEMVYVVCHGNPPSDAMFDDLRFGSLPLPPRTVMESLVYQTRRAKSGIADIARSIRSIFLILLCCAPRRS